MTTKKLSPKTKSKVVKNAALTAADSVDEQLARYRSMRDFGVTAEPSGGKSSKPRRTGALPFVIQKHAASHLHYDFRLGWNGVLKSWACAKGPSFYPGDRRLAVQVEDHPMEYGGFEGIIPQGQYGGGTVMLWDQGTWTPQPGYENVDAGLRDGSLKFTMHGTKMRGNWTLVRMNSRPADKGGRWGSSSKPNWLLIKEHDDFEHGKDDPAITEAAPDSVVTGRTMEQIAKQEDHVWNSKETAKPGQAWFRTETRRERKSQRNPAPAARKLAKDAGTQALELSELPRETQPTFIKPQLAQEATGPPGNDGWLHELKLDGYRIQARKHGTTVQMFTRSGLDWTHRIPEVAEAVAKLLPDKITLDGEVVVLKPDGTTDFADLQASFQEGAKNPLTYFCFDLLHLDGRDSRGLPLRARKELLSKLLPDADGVVRYSEHIETGGEEMFRKACELHAEGIISKRAGAPYRSGRSADWLKSKCLHEQEFVVGGYTASSDGDDRIGSLLLGYYQDEKLIYAGRTGTGFTQKARRQLKSDLDPLKQPNFAFYRVPSEAKRGAIWVKPKLVAQVRFATWTAEDLVRQAAFLGLREDKNAAEVRREGPTTPPLPKRASATPGVERMRAHCAPSSSTVPIRLTHPQKILDADSSLTKQQLAEYYWAVAARMLPHIADRPLSLVRCPEGSGKPCFFQKHVNHMLPPGIGSVDVPDKKTGKPDAYITLNTPEALAGLAQMGVLEVHPWGSRNSDLEHPDRLIFDIDPDTSIPWETLCEAANDVRSRLKQLGLTSFLKTTGGKGLHVVAPITPRAAWPAVKEFAHRFVLDMERSSPALYLTRMTKAARRGKLYLDYLRNDRGATAVAPYSPRARPGMAVSMPVAWSALRMSAAPAFTVATFEDWRTSLKADPWKGFFTVQQQLP